MKHEKLAKYNVTILITVNWEYIVDKWLSRLLIMANLWIISIENHYNCKLFDWLKKIDKDHNKDKQIIFDIFVWFALIHKQ